MVKYFYQKKNYNKQELSQEMSSNIHSKNKVELLGAEDGSPGSSVHCIYNSDFMNKIEVRSNTVHPSISDRRNHAKVFQSFFQVADFDAICSITINIIRFQ